MSEGNGAERPAIDVAIVNWNTAEAALAAARGYLASEGVEPRLTIVDNDSAPEQRRILEDGAPDGVRILLEDANLGYAKAANRGLLGGSGELVCVSNPDLLPEPGALAALAAVVRAQPRAGMVGPAFGDTDTYHANLPGPATMLARIFVGSFNTRSPELPQGGETIEIDQPSGACFVVRREVWEQLDGFDEGFYLWYDDVDLARRLRDRGYANFVTGSARVGHVGAAAFVQMDQARKQAIRLRSVEHYIRVHHPGAVPVAVPMLAISRRLRAHGAG